MPHLCEEQMKLNNLDAKELVASSPQGKCESSKASQIQHRLSLTGQFQFRKKKEKSTAVLVSIVVLFVFCHIYRLSLKIYEFAKPSSHVMDSFTYCYQQSRLDNLIFNCFNLQFFFLFQISCSCDHVCFAQFSLPVFGVEFFSQFCDLLLCCQ